MQRKTGRPVQFEIIEQPREAVGRWLEKKELRKGEPLFCSRINRRRSMTTRQYARLLGSWLHSIGLNPLAYGTDSLLRTKASMIYRRTGNLRAVQLPLGHTTIESTVRYLGIDVDDARRAKERQFGSVYPPRVQLHHVSLISCRTGGLVSGRVRRMNSVHAFPAAAMVSRRPCGSSANPGPPYRFDCDLSSG
jgi:hypothetical protein